MCLHIKNVFIKSQNNKDTYKQDIKKNGRKNCIISLKVQEEIRYQIF